MCRSSEGIVGDIDIVVNLNKPVHSAYKTLWTSDLLQRSDTGGRFIPNLQPIQSFHIIFIEFKVEDIRVGLDPLR